jgi:ABC-type nitrate/sulfonate/bicarbonate transport system permease component
MTVQAKNGSLELRTSLVDAIKREKHAANQRVIRQYLTYLVSFVTIFGLWQIMATYVIPSVLFPPPWPVALRMGRMIASGDLWAHVSISLQRIILGFSLGSIAGVAIGLFMGSFTVVRHFFEPYVNFFRFVPGIALITVAVIWLGIGEESKVFLIIYTTIFIVIINTMAGALAVSTNKVRAARCLGAREMQVFWFVIIPSTVPYIVTGMRIAMANSFATIVSAEMLGASVGLGTVIWTSRLFMLVEDVFVALVVLGGLGFIADRLFVMVSNRFGGRYGSVA